MFNKLFNWIDKLLGIEDDDDDFYDDEINIHRIMLEILMERTIKEGDSIEG